MTQNVTESVVEALVPRDMLGLPNDYVAPESPIEHRLTDAFSKIMRVSPVGLDDDFYDLGGDSLQGEQISIAVEEILGREFQISSLFYTGTPRKIAETGAPAGTAPAPETKPILFIVHGKRGYTMPRKEFLEAVDGFCTVEMFEMPGIRGNGEPPKSLEAIAKAYCDRIETLQPEGEIALAAFCAGGLVALDMIRQLNARGRILRGVVLIDPNVSPRLAKLYANYQKAVTPFTKLKSRMYAFGTTGRLSETRPFLQDKFRASHVRRLLANKEKRLILRGRKSHHASDVAPQTLDATAQAWLFASYRYAVFEQIPNQIAIVASADRMAQFTDPKGFWAYVAPNLAATEVAGKHSEVFQQEGARTVAVLKARLFAEPQQS